MHEASPTFGDRHAAGGGTPFLGRDQELSRLRALLDEALAGRGAVVIVSGEPGIGKTRTAEWLARRAREGGVEVRVGLCDERGAAPPFWPWSQILHQDVEDPRVEPDSPGLTEAAIDALLPAASGLARRDADRGPSDDDAFRYEAFRRVLGLLSRRAAERPRLLVIDDVHAADGASLELVRYAAHELVGDPIAILATCRDVESAWSRSAEELLGRVRQEAPEVALGGLDEAAVGALLEAVSGRPAPSGLRRATFERTRGNPLFVEEVARTLARRPDGQGASWRVAGEARMPETMRRCVIQRCRVLSPDARRWLEVASVAGRDFELALVARAMGGHASSRALDEAVGARLVEPSARRPGWMRFSHALVRDAVYDELSLESRVAIHTRVGEALEARPPRVREERMAELAHHFVRTHSPDHAGRVVRYATRAGEQALARFAYHDAVEHFETALRALSVDPSAPRSCCGGPEPDLGHCRLLLRLAAACRHAGDAERARDASRKAAALARRRGCSGCLAEAALALAGRGEILSPVEPEAVALLEEARAKLPDEPTPIRARLLARLARALSLDTEPGAAERRDAWSREAERIATDLADSRALYDALHARHVALARPDAVERRLALSSRMLDVASRLGSRRLALGAYLLRAADRLELGDGAGFRLDLDAYAAITRAVDEPFFSWLDLGLRTTVALLEGRFGEAERLATEAFAMGRRAQAANAGPWYVIQLSALRRAQGRMGELEGAIREAIRTSPGVAAYRIGLAFCLCESDRLDEAREAFESAMACDLDDFPRDAVWTNVLSEAAVCCHRLDDRERARLVHALLRPYDGRVVVCGAANGCEGAVSYFLGLLETTFGETDAALRHFDDALTANQRLGAAPYVALARRDRALLLLREAGTEAGDHHRELARAVSELEALGMRADAARGRPGKDAPRDHAPRGELCRDDEGWSIAFAGRTARVRDVRGMHYLAALLAAPGQERHALDLAAGASGRGERNAALVVLDARARRDYRDRIATLRAEIDEADVRRDRGRTERMREELAMLERELANAFGLGGRARRLGDPAERARKAVYNRLRDAVARIGTVHPELARHLSHSLRTGLFCSYEPEHTVDWRVHDRRRRATRRVSTSNASSGPGSA